MTEDAAFIRAVREHPDDETTRLVYADWLDDRADPRAGYLRAEAAWVLLQPSDEQYRPLYRRVSQLAALIDPAWFAEVSRMGLLVGRAWALVSPGFASGVPPAERPRAWGETVEPLRALFAETFGAEEVARRFCAPADFAAFQTVVGGRDNGWDRFSCSRSLPGTNRTSISIYQPGRPSADDLTDEELAERPHNPEMWLEFGGWSDKHWYFICCDLGSPLFGVVAEGHDYHPWMAGIEPLDYRGRNVLHFLTGYFPLVRHGERSSWPRLAHREWATY
jgi:uncharacterized protein (TIGR02996 family)